MDVFHLLCLVCVQEKCPTLALIDIDALMAQDTFSTWRFHLRLQLKFANGSTYIIRLRRIPLWWQLRSMPYSLRLGSVAARALFYLVLAIMVANTFNLNKLRSEFLPLSFTFLGQKEKRTWEDSFFFTFR
jgi:hypothetical protein